MSYIKRPDGIIDAVLDTDTFNEVDDQFALSLLLGLGDRIRLKSIYAAPFHDSAGVFFNTKSDSASDGMEKSYQEIIRLLDLSDRNDMRTCVYRGADRFMASESTPVESDAAYDLIESAMEYSPDDPLYVIGIAAPTNIASALLLRPEIASRIVVIWLGGNTLDWPTCREFNLSQDLNASRVLFGKAEKLVQVPCMGMASSFSVSEAEICSHIKGKNKLCDYLAEIVLDEMDRYSGIISKSRILWDVTACAWLLGESFAMDRLEKRPVPGTENYEYPGRSMDMNYVFYINRDLLLNELIGRLTFENAKSR
ncbi:MAG: nucleoside hydrolase [Lachnospiraceae bacterium]|nr:nucleoside hydrolase [Lachnospiraceae bacterium]